MATYLIIRVCTPPKKIFVAPQLLPTHHQIAFQPCYFLQHLPLFLRNLKFRIFVKIVTKGEFAIYFTVFCLCNRHFFRVHPLSPIKLSSFCKNSQLHCDSRLSSSLSTTERQQQLSRERTSRATNGQKGFQWAIRSAGFQLHHTLIYVLNVSLCCSFFCSGVNLLIYVFTRLTDAGANNTFDFSIKARTSPLDRQIVSRSQRAYALGVVQVRLNLIVLISIFLSWNIFAVTIIFCINFFSSLASKWRLPTLWEFSNDFSTQVA